MDAKPNLQVSSNLMLVEIQGRQVDPVRFIPGDFVGQVYEWTRDARAEEMYLTPEQLVERRQYLVCLICGRPCAGTCEHEG